MHDFLMIFEKTKTTTTKLPDCFQDYYGDITHVSYIRARVCDTESMIPLRAWKPPQTGNTCSTVSAMVASCRNVGLPSLKCIVCVHWHFLTSDLSPGSG